MASAKIMVGFLLMVALFGASHGLGAVHTVGGSSGWTSTENINYTQWASNQTFNVGDTILFVYNSGFHNVMVVTRYDFRSCNPTSAIATYTSGMDSITLQRSGHFYFLCGAPGKCQAGQKVDVKSSQGEGPSASESPSPSPFFVGSLPTTNPSSEIQAPDPAQSRAQSLIFTLLSMTLILAIIGLFF